MDVVLNVIKKKRRLHMNIKFDCTWTFLHNLLRIEMEFTMFKIVQSY